MRIREIAQTQVRYGYRMIRVRLNREGWNVGKDLVYRLYKGEGLARVNGWQESAGPLRTARSAFDRLGRTEYGQWTSSPINSAMGDGSPV
jgi:putative transposase